MKKREKKPMLKQNKINQIDNPKGAKKGFRYKAAAAAFAILGTFMLASCSFEPTIPNNTPIPTPEPTPIEQPQEEEINYENGCWRITIAGFATEREAVEAANIVGQGKLTLDVGKSVYKGQETWVVSSSIFPIEYVENIKQLDGDNLKFALYGPYQKITFSNLTADELKYVYSNLDISHGDISIAQKESGNNYMNIGYQVELDSLLNTDAEKVKQLITNSTKVRELAFDKSFAYDVTKEEVLDIFNVDKNDLTATYQDNYGSVDSFLSVIGDDLSNTKITKIIDVDGQEIATRSEPELGL